MPLRRAAAAKEQEPAPVPDPHLILLEHIAKEQRETNKAVRALTGEVSELRGHVETGFDGVNARFDDLNDRYNTDHSTAEKKDKPGNTPGWRDLLRGAGEFTFSEFVSTALKTLVKWKTVGYLVGVVAVSVATAFGCSHLAPAHATQHVPAQVQNK